MGEMMVNIRSYFKKNSLFYGYTGTPLFDENQATGMINEKSEVIDTTEKLFGPELHKYTIDQAIGDGNVLGFHVDYINTGEFLSHEDLKDRIKEQIQIEKPEMTVRKIERLVQNWTDLVIEKEAKKRKILTYQDKTHIPRVVEEILFNWQDQSQERHFNSILTVAYKEGVLQYYNEFKRQLEGQEDKINIAMTFSFGNENDPDNIPLEIIDSMFKDYAKFTGIEFISGDRKRGEEAYFEDIVDRGTRGGSGRNKKNVDLIVVADQLLTGYDSRFLNTLYVDRDLRLQSLIQAYSRTNRIYGKDKEFVETELVPGKISSDLSFDQSFDNWKNKKAEKEIKGFAKYWGIDGYLLSKSLDNFSIVQDDTVPYIAEISESVDFSKATNKEAENELEHRINLLNKVLPEWIIEVKKKYN